MVNSLYFLFLFPCFFFLFSVGQLYSGDLSIAGSNYSEYWIWQKDYKEHFEDRFGLTISYKDFKGNIGGFIYTPSQLDKAIKYPIFSFEYRKSPFNILLGDYYATFGRGLTLREYLDQEFKHDKTFQGLKVHFGSEDVNITVISGYPKNIIFEQNLYRIVNPTTDLIRGVNLKTNIKNIPFLSSLNLEERYVRLNRGEDISLGAFTELFGGNIGTSGELLDLYFEYAKKLGCHPVTASRVKGQGVYFSGSFSISRFGFSGEWLNYDSLGCGGYDYRYNDPPTPNQRGASINRGMDEKGYGVTLTSMLVEKLFIETGYSNLETKDKNKWLSEVYGEARFDPVDYMSLSLSLDRFHQKGIETEVKHKIETMPKLGITYTHNPRNSIEMEYGCNFIKEYTLTTYLENEITVSYARSPTFTFTIHATHRSKKVERLGDEICWLSGEFGINITQNATLKVRIGSEKGGLVCSGGVCRWEEPFKGIKIILINTF